MSRELSPNTGSYFIYVSGICSQYERPILSWLWHWILVSNKEGLSCSSSGNVQYDRDLQQALFWTTICQQ